MWQFDVHRTFVYWEIWFGYTLLHMLLFVFVFFTDTPNKEVGQHKLDAKYRKTHQEMTKKKTEEKENQIHQGKSRTHQAVYSHQASVRHDVICFIKVKKKEGASCGLLFV